MKLRCPICHSAFTVESLCQDDAGRELLGLVARLPGHIAAPVIGYVGLFRAANRDLANDRALRLLNETLALAGDTERLAQACSQVVEIMRNKQQSSSEWKPLSNHNYLKKVLADIPATAPVACAPAMLSGPTSKTAAGVAGFQRARHGG
jgi:hypothetical protein